MSLPDFLSIILGGSLTGYAIFAGGDFGAGILDLLAGRRRAHRAAIATAIGPVWEANHVWLIFSITILFAAFPAAFAALGTALLAPLTVALLAIVLRGVALGLRTDPGGPARSQRLLGRLFGAASLVAALMFGAVAGALAQASRSTRPRASTATPIPWTGAFPIVVAVLALALCALLAASLLTRRLERCGQPQLAEHFRRRGLQAAGAVALLGVLALVAAASAAPDLSRRLHGTALPFVIAGFATVTLALVAFAGRRYLLARTASLLTGASLVWGWLVAQSPDLIGTRWTIHSAAATPAALTAIAIAGGVVLIMVLPALYLLFRVYARTVPEVIE